MWALYGFLPLIWIPAGVGAYVALGKSHPGTMLAALQFALRSAISMMLGLLRWPTIHWRLAELYTTADASPQQRQVIAAIFDGLNVYLGNYLGEFLGELSFSTFFVLPAWALLRSRATANWVAIAGLLTGVMGWIGMFRNLTTAVAPIAEINNYLLPLWMVALGVVLLRYKGPVLMEVPKMSQANLVSISTFRSTADAQIAKGILDEAGIDSMIRADNAGGMYPAMSGADLLVRSDDADRANDLLQRSDRDAD